MKLEIKHLAPYLPYGLNVQVMYNTGFKVEKLKELKISEINLFGKQIMPILKPLSDLAFCYNEICYGLMDARNPNNYKSSKFDIDLVIRNGVMFDTDNGFVN
jgi:hypothetical protein